MASQKIRKKEEEPRSDSYRYAVQPQFSTDGLTAEGKPIKKRKKTRRPMFEDIDELKDELKIVEHTVPMPELSEKLGINFDIGISAERAKYTLERDGPNELSPPRSTPEWVIFCKQLFGGFSIMLWTASVLSFVVYSIHAATLEKPPPDNLYLGFILAGIVIMQGCFTYYQECDSAKIMPKFKDADFVPMNTFVIRKKELVQIHSQELVVGDIVELQTHDRVPADIRIIWAQNFKVDNSAITGESEPQIRTSEFTSENPLQTRNLVFFPTKVVEGKARGVVVGTGDRTLLGRITKVASLSTEPQHSPLALEINRLVHIIAAIGVIVSLLFFFLSLIVGFLWLDALIYLIGLIVACVPEGLLISITVVLALSAQRMALSNCLVRNLEVIEALGSTSTICTDKSGVLTQNKMFVAHMWFDNRIVEADLTPEQSNALYNRDSVTWLAMARVAMLCNRAQFRGGQDTMPPLRRECRGGDTTDSTLLKFTEHAVGNVTDYCARNTQVCEIPFNSVSKYQVSVRRLEDRRDPRYLVTMKGAPERVLDRCRTILINGEEQPLTGQWREAFHRAYLELGGLGERVIGFCDLRLPIERFPDGYPFSADDENFPTVDMRFLGLISMIDPPRSAVPDAVAKCRTAGIRVIMITGDHPITAKAIAKGVGIISEGSETVEDIAARIGIPTTEVDPRDARACVVHGSDLHDMTPQQLDVILYCHPEVVFARMTPMQKLSVVDGCQRQGNIVAVTGDGLSDSPALKKADIGIAMGMSGSRVSKETADVILLDDNFASIVTGIEEGRIVIDNLKKCILYTLTSNMPEMVAFVMFIILDIPLPLGALTIICIDMGTDIVPAITLAFEKAESDIMKRAPRDLKHDQLVNHKLLLLAFGQAGVIEVCGGFFMYFVVMAESGWWPARLLTQRDEWNSKGVNDLEDAYGQEWTFAQRKVLEFTSQSSFFIAIVMMQWANLIVCKTRKSSVITQQMMNFPLTLSLFGAMLLAMLLVYCPGLDKGLRMYPLRFLWWIAPLPFVIAILVYEELRKMFMRNNQGGFLEFETYY